MKTPKLETKRLLLLPVTLEDAPAIQKYFNNWNIIKNLSKVVPWPYPDDGAVTFLKEMALPKVEEGNAFIWAIRLKEGPDEAVGLIDLRLKENHGGNRGFWLAEPYWKNGYMTEAVIAVQDFIFFDLKVNKIIVMNVKGNKGSKRVKEKTGAKYLGITELEHHSGDVKTEKWEVTRKAWSEYRLRS
jgi:RimJ/RimL family protein N-acetyltransferase